MIELTDALALVEHTAAPLPPRRQRLAAAVGRRLAAGIIADGDSPPWDRAMMDGFAVRDADLAGGGIVELDVVTDLAAGDVTSLTLRPGCCARIMTGAPLPPGADAVVPVERAVDGTAGTHAGGRVRLHEEKFRSGQHVGRQGTAYRRGQEVLAAGMWLGAAEIALAAEAGATHVVAEAPVRVAILQTGSELVPPDVEPAFGQTRNSNGPMLAAAVTLLGGEPISLGIAVDRPEAIRAAVAKGLAADVLLLSGGVSAGDLDLVPGILAACGVDEVFHKVRLKPGKPVWFGRLPRPAGESPTLVFGLPGNPVSSLVCFELFVRPALAILAGRPRGAWHLPRTTARLTASVKAAPDRPVYLPGRLRPMTVGAGSRSVDARGAARLEIAPLHWMGSSDLLGMAGASGLIALPADAGLIAAGAEVEVLVRDSGTSDGRS
jgi:molybdopterin molybdotransferase